jgi:hypothetical protein
LKNVNFANVRSAIGATIALVLLILPAPASAFKRPTETVLTWLPPSTTVSQLAAAGFSPGVMSAGLGTVPAQQTYLDVGQGNRVFDSLYDSDLPALGSSCYPWLEEVEKRAESAPADIIPALLTKSARFNGVAVFYEGGSSCAFGGAAGTGQGGIGGRILLIGDMSLPQARSRLKLLRRGDLLLAIARPTGRSDDPLPIGIAGDGFDGNLTSDSTRLDGYVLSTDVAPTILGHLGIEVPSEMSGQRIRGEGSVDPAAVESLARRMGVISPRRGPVIGLSLLLWAVVLLAAIAASRGAAARSGVRVLALSVVYLPLLLLGGAAIEPGEWAEAALVAFGSPLLAALTLRLWPGYRALGVAAGATVLAYAADVVAGSPLTSLSLLGPNPGLGVRFYGVGNELEAVLAVLVVAGTGAALAGFAPALSRRRSALAFLGVGLLCAFVFAAGRFGADVGAAIVLPVGAAAAAAGLVGRRRRALLAVIATPFAALALLALIDLASGANAHLTRSVLDAGGLGDLSDVAQRRLQLSAHSFVRPILAIFLPVVAALAVLAVAQRERLRTWLAGRAAMRAGLLGALSATVVGTLANDSGALLLVIGSAYLLVFVGYAWAESPHSGDPQTKSYNSVRHAYDLNP